MAARAHVFRQHVQLLPSECDSDCDCDDREEGVKGRVVARSHKIEPIL